MAVVGRTNGNINDLRLFPVTRRDSTAFIIAQVIRIMGRPTGVARSVVFRRPSFRSSVPSINYTTANIDRSAQRKHEEGLGLSMDRTDESSAPRRVGTASYRQPSRMHLSKLISGAERLSPPLLIRRTRKVKTYTIMACAQLAALIR